MIEAMTVTTHDPSTSAKRLRLVATGPRSATTLIVAEMVTVSADRTQTIYATVNLNQSL
jgi:hypothetical protein